MYAYILEVSHTHLELPEVGAVLGVQLCEKEGIRGHTGLGAGPPDNQRLTSGHVERVSEEKEIMGCRLSRLFPPYMPWPKEIRKIEGPTL